MDGKKHWLTKVEDSINYAWSQILKEKSEVKDVMTLLLKELKAMCGVTVRYACSNNAGEN